MSGTLLRLGQLRLRSSLYMGAILAFFSAGGCSSNLSLLDRFLVIPSYYEALPCTALVPLSKQNAARANELQSLMEKSANPIVNAVAYETEYAKAVAAQHAAERASELKQCEQAKTGTDPLK